MKIIADGRGVFSLQLHGQRQIKTLPDPDFPFGPTETRIAEIQADFRNIRRKFEPRNIELDLIVETDQNRIDEALICSEIGFELFEQALMHLRHEVEDVSLDAIDVFRSAELEFVRLCIALIEFFEHRRHLCAVVRFPRVGANLDVETVDNYQVPYRRKTGGDLFRFRNQAFEAARGNVLRYPRSEPPESARAGLCGRQSLREACQRPTVAAHRLQKPALLLARMIPFGRPIQSGADRAHVLSKGSDHGHYVPVFEIAHDFLAKCNGIDIVQGHPKKRTEIVGLLASRYRGDDLIQIEIPKEIRGARPDVAKKVRVIEKKDAPEARCLIPGFGFRRTRMRVWGRAELHRLLP
ncbi:MAG TPA: hypothetical protein VMF67_14235 [Rhizomicrobium sp.]|nr:hypothetical protein [Rhizomicrobium sp.]